ncbi:MAG: hypothetical protein JWP74_698 [Marmoricola sp.]|nr:hypothetical protein [Marmoricola sp.]
MTAEDTFTASRRALHGVAELLLAGPQHAASGTITLRPTPSGFATTRLPDHRLVGTDVVVGDRSVPIHGSTLRQIADELGFVPCSLTHVYADGAGVDPDEVLSVTAADAALIAAAYAVGDAALRQLAPDQTPILWPEHFDLGISVDADRVNYGVSPGDSALDRPYAYVGPWDTFTPDTFWNQSFGAAIPVPGTVSELVAFFAEGRRLLTA